MNPDSFLRRRTELIGLMQQGVAVIPTASERIRNRDTHYPYRFDSSFYYLTGFTEPEAVLVLLAGNPSKHILFCREKDPEREIWDGFRYGPEAACEHFKFDECHAISKLDEVMPPLLQDQVTLFYAMGSDTEWDTRMMAWINAVRAQSRTGVTPPTQIVDVRKLVDEMRLFKDTEEQALMRQAANISGAAHRRTMQLVKPDMMEYEVEAELLREFRRHGAQAPAYPPIVAGGANACVLHYVENNKPLNSGELLLIDAGCELNGYASDITRTFPINGRFSNAQKDVYEIVLAAQTAAIDAARPGNTWDFPHTQAVRVLAQGFIDLGMCQGSVDAVIESGAYKQFYMHRTGHWLGLDVHDVGEYKDAGHWRKLQPGMTLTVEPGCYIRPHDNVPKAFWNIGIRIEDDVLITDTGCEVLTEEAPKTINEIQSVMAGG